MMSWVWRVWCISSILRLFRLDPTIRVRALGLHSDHVAHNRSSHFCSVCKGTKATVMKTLRLQETASYHVSHIAMMKYVQVTEHPSPNSVTLFQDSVPKQRCSRVVCKQVNGHLIITETGLERGSKSSLANGWLCYT